MATDGDQCGGFLLTEKGEGIPRVIPQRPLLAHQVRYSQSEQHKDSRSGKAYNDRERLDKFDVEFTFGCDLASLSSHATIVHQG